MRSILTPVEDKLEGVSKAQSPIWGVLLPIIIKVLDYIKLRFCTFLVDGTISRQPSLAG